MTVQIGSSQATVSVQDQLDTSTSSRRKLQRLPVWAGAVSVSAVSAGATAAVIGSGSGAGGRASAG
ncbi:MAG: hypothetical protein R3D59_00720 [Paracoccaceae bacterium]